MFEFPKLVVIIAVFAVVWWGYRRLNGIPRDLPRRHTRPGRAGGQQRRTADRRPAIEAEDLVACGACGAYVATSAPGCGRPDCPKGR